MRRWLLVATSLAMLAARPAWAAGEVHAAGYGPATARLSGIACAAPLAVTINVEAGELVITETWGPGMSGAPTNGPCQPGPGATIANAPNFTRSGSTYTVETSSGSGTTAFHNKVVVTVTAGRLDYLHTVTQAGVVISHIAATLPRMV